MDMERKMIKCVGEVELPDLRHELIMRFLDLSDADYQQREWIENWKDKAPYPERSFGDDIERYRDFFEDWGVFNYVDQRKVPYEDIGSWLKTEQEAEALYKVAEHLLPLPMECLTNAEYLSSPHLPKLREAAKEAFDIFMANEKDDKEFCERVEKVKQEHAGIQAAEAHQTSYQAHDSKATADESSPLHFKHFHLTPELQKSLADACAKTNFDAMVKLFGQCGWKIDKRVFDKIPAHLKAAGAKLDNCMYFERPRGGVRFTHLEDDSVIKEKDGIHIVQVYSVVVDELRILQGNPNAFWPTQQRDHVQVVSGGKMLRGDGMVLKNKPEDQTSVDHNTCIPIKEWLAWKSWNAIPVPAELKYKPEAAKVTDGGKDYVSSAQHFSITEKGKKDLGRALRLWDVASLVNVLKESGWNLDGSVLDRVPQHLRSVNARLDDCVSFPKPRGGLKFANLAYGNAVNYVRLLQGDPKAFWKEQQQDYVQIVTGGKMLARDGTVREEKPDGTQPPNPDTCIPLKEWLEWAEWNRKL
jgi:hypothetical protein